MNRLDRLAMKVKKALGPPKIINVLVDQMAGAWAVSASFWDGKAGHTPRVEHSVHSDIDAAMGRAQKLAAQYPNHLDLVILVDDI